MLFPVLQSKLRNSPVTCELATQELSDFTNAINIHNAGYLASQVEDIRFLDCNALDDFGRILHLEDGAP